MIETPEKSVRVVIYGRVQGVWFRSWVVQEARARALRGWVRNRRDGTVEAVFAGADEKVNSMVRACHLGPRHARVGKVEVTPAAAPDDADFHQIPTS